MLLKDVVVALQCHQSGIWNERGKVPALLVGDALVLSRVQDERRLSDLARGVTDGEVAAGEPEPRGHLDSARDLLDLVVRESDAVGGGAEAGLGADPAKPLTARWLTSGGGQKIICA